MRRDASRKATELLKEDSPEVASLIEWLDPLGKNSLHVVHCRLAEGDRRRWNFADLGKQLGLFGVAA